MRIRKRLASQCGATAAAGRAGQALKQGSDFREQPADYKQLMQPQRPYIAAAEGHSESRKLAHIDQSSVAPSPSKAADSTEASPSSTPVQVLQTHDHRALFLQDNWESQTLQIQERSSTHGRSGTTCPFDVDKNAKGASAQQLQANSECDAGTFTTAATRYKDKVLQTAGAQLPTCLPVAAAIHHGQITESTEIHSQIDLDKQISSSIPLLNVDHNRNLTKQVSPCKDSGVKESKEDTSCNENTSRKFRTFLPVVTENLNEQKNFMKTLTSDSDPQHCEGYNKVQGTLDWGIEDHLRCGRRSGQGWQCKNKRAPDGGSIYCDYHQSKITLHRATWSTRKRTMKENKRIYTQSSWPGHNMVDVKLLELPLFPSKQHMYGNLQAQDKVSSQSGAISERMSQAAGYSKVQPVSNICTDDLDLKLAPSSKALPSLVETDMPTKPYAQLSQNCMESPALENFSFKRRRVDGVATSEMRTDTDKLDHFLTEVTIMRANPEDLNAIRVFGSSLGIMKDDTNRSESRSMNSNIGISIVIDKQDARGVGHVDSMCEPKWLPNSTLEQELSAHNDKCHLQQVSRKQSNTLVKEQETNSIIACIQSNDQGQQCKRHDGRGWRCKRTCAPGKLYCEHHARKQRSYVNQIKKENKNNFELQQRLQQVYSRSAYKAKSKLTQHILQEIHLEPRTKVHKAIQPEAKHDTELGRSNDEMRDKEKQVVAPSNQLPDGDEKEHEGKTSVVRKSGTEAEGKPNVEKVVANEHEGQDPAKRVQVGSQRRCGRHDGRGWQCKSKCMPGSVYCEHHKEKLRRYHTNWNVNCVLKRHHGHGALQQTGSDATSTMEATAEDDDADDRKEKPCEQTESGAGCNRPTAVMSQQETAEDDEDERKEKDGIVKAAPAAPCKRKRRFLHHIYARCNA